VADLLHSERLGDGALRISGSGHVPLDEELEGKELAV